MRWRPIRCFKPFCFEIGVAGGRESNDEAADGQEEESDSSSPPFISLVFFFFGGPLSQCRVSSWPRATFLNPPSSFFLFVHPLLAVATVPEEASAQVPASQQQIKRTPPPSPLFLGELRVYALRLSLLVLLQ